MAGKVIIGGFFELNAVDRSQFIESIEPNFELEHQEHRLFNTGSGDATAVGKEPGISNNSFNVTTVENTTWVFFVALNAIKGTKVAFKFRGSSAAKGATNPEWSGTCIVPHTVPSINQGELARTTLTFQVDGAVTFDNT